MGGIKIRELSKSFKSSTSPALDRITADIEPGGITGLVGPDGAGKTTLLRIVCGLMRPTSGSLSVSDVDPTRDPSAAHEIVGYMPQKFGLYEDLTVYENLVLYARMRGVPKDEREARFDRLLKFTRLSPFTERLAGALSGGMKQKLGLACTLLAEPSVLLLDEPGVGVDPVARRELWGMVRELATPERTVVWSTAYLNEAEACDSVVLMNEGTILYSGTPADLSARTSGRVFFIHGTAGLKRAMITPLLCEDSVVDAVIQGSRIRVVTHDDGSELRTRSGGIAEQAAKESRASMLPDMSITEATPRFEDAFMDILGGARRPSDLMQHLFRDRLAESSERLETVRAETLTKRFGSFTAVDGISFSIRQGEIFGLLGPNGAGKSTTFKMMCGLLVPTDGRCSVAGMDLRRAPGKARARLGYMAQKFSLYGGLTVKQNLEFFGGVYGLKGASLKHAIDAVVEALEFKDYMNSSSGALPLGFKQRLSLACAIMHGPDALFLDEPTSGVDPVMRREFWTYINAVVELGVTVLVTTHFMDEAEYCDRVALVYGGRVIASGAPDDLKQASASGDMPDPTMEDAFITLIERDDADRRQRSR